MPKFEVVITETLAKSVIVEAEDEKAAFWQVRNGYYNGDYVLYAEDLFDVDFETYTADDDAILTENENI